MPDQKIIVRISLTTGIIFSIICLPAPIIGLIALFKNPPIEYLKLAEATVTLFVFPLFILFWACSTRVYLEGKILTYSILLFKRHCINLESVTRVEVTARPTAMLKLYRGHSKHMEFIIKPFSKNGVTFLLHYIKLHAPNAQFDLISSDLEHGDFASVTREAIKLQNWIQFFSRIVVLFFLLAFIKVKHAHPIPLTVGIIGIVVLILAVFLSRKRKK